MFKSKHACLFKSHRHFSCVFECENI